MCLHILITSWSLLPSLTQSRLCCQTDFLEDYSLAQDLYCLVPSYFFSFLLPFRCLMPHLSHFLAGPLDWNSQFPLLLHYFLGAAWMLLPPWSFPILSALNSLLQSPMSWTGAKGPSKSTAIWQKHSPLSSTVSNLHSLQIYISSFPPFSVWLCFLTQEIQRSQWDNINFLTVNLHI